MHLLNTTTKRLESYYGKDIPPYAILSHTWGQAKDEVLFKHITGSENDRLDGESRKGYTKITAACEQAIKDGYGHIWIDTCCIDKESSAELSEAINSMYMWYKGSDVCYVYLEDVWNDGDTKGNEDASFNIAQFEHSRWFSRGWTLQELIAPRRVVFYSKDWIDIGTKATLQDSISNVTRIRVEMITGYDPQKASVAERMSWAASRETTRDEDAAYCLMGIFGVNMPLLYGEGTRAFMRLQEEIMRHSDDHSIFAWKASSSANQQGWETRGLLADSPRDFRETGNVIRSNDQVASSPYSMTNQGLQVNLLLQPLDAKIDRDIICFLDNKKVFRALLKCTYRDKKPTERIIIYLEMNSRGCYVRIFPHWLDETENWMNQYQNPFRLTPLFVMQVNTHTNNANLAGGNINILPTESGFTFEDHSLARGYNYSDNGFGRTEVAIFNREGKHFGVVVGDDNGIPWLDAIKEDDMFAFSQTVNSKIKPREEDIVTKIKSLYGEGGSRCNIVVRHLDRLSINISVEWVVNISAKLTRRCSFLEVFVDIRRVTEDQNVPVLIKKSYDANTHMPTSGDSTISSNRDIHSPAFRRVGNGWLAAFNPKVERVLDVDLVHTFSHERLNCVCFSPDGKYLAVGSYRKLQIYSIGTGNEICSLSNTPTVNSALPSFYRSVSFSPNGRLLAAGGDNQITIWDINKRNVCNIFGGYKESISSIDFSLDGQLIISGSDDTIVRIWNIADESSKVLIIGSAGSRSTHGWLMAIAISPNSRFIAVGNGSDIIQIWDITTSQLVQRLKGHNSPVYSIVFTQDGEGLVSGGHGGIMKYWDISGLIMGKPSRCIMNFAGHTRDIPSVAISHNGMWVVSGSHDENVLFWDLRNANIQFILRTNTGAVSSVDMSPVGNFFATSNYNDTVQIWSYNTI